AAPGCHALGERGGGFPARQDRDLQAARARRVPRAIAAHADGEGAEGAAQGAGGGRGGALGGWGPPARAGHAVEETQGDADETGRYQTLRRGGPALYGGRLL